MPGIDAGKHRFRFLDETLESADAGYGNSDRSFHTTKDLFKIWKHLSISPMGRIGKVTCPLKMGLVAPSMQLSVHLTGRGSACLVFQ